MKILKIILMIIIICSFVLVGTPIKYNCLILNLIIILIATILRIYKITKKETIFNKKIDIVVLIFCISPIIPLIFKTYSSLEESLISLIRNMSLYNIYYIANELRDEEKKSIIDAILIGGIILAVLGIEEMTIGVLYKKLEIIGIPFVVNIEHRMFSSLGYTNSFAIIMLIEILLCTGRMKNNKILYSILIALFGACMFLTYSRAVIMIAIIMITLYVIIVKRKTKYVVILGIISIGIYLVGIRLDIPLKLFTEQEESSMERRTIRNIEKDTEYTFLFETEAKTKLRRAQNYIIEVAEENKYYDTIEKHEIYIGNETGTKEIKFKTSKEVDTIVIYFRSILKMTQQGLTIKSLQINGEKYPLKYAYLPIKLVEKIQSISYKDKSVWERLVYFKDATKIIKDNIWLGTGAKGWQYNYEDYQEYFYQTTESHSFILQVFIENGIVGFISLIILIIYSFVNITKRKNKIRIIDLAFIILTLHSFMDFDMSFYCIMVLWIVLFSIAIKDYQADSVTIIKKENKKLIHISIIIINIAVLTLGLYTYILQKDNKQKLEEIDNLIREKQYNEAIEEIKKYESKEKKNDFFSILDRINYFNVNDENIEFIFNKLKDEKILVNTEKNMKRNQILLKMLEETRNKEISLRISDVLINENEKIIENIRNREKNRLTEDEINNYIEEQQTYFNRANEILE